jgi:hypothetical protein
MLQQSLITPSLLPLDIKNGQVLGLMSSNMLRESDGENIIFF